MRVTMRGMTRLGCWILAGLLIGVGTGFLVAAAQVDDPKQFCPLSAAADGPEIPAEQQRQNDECFRRGESEHRSAVRRKRYLRVVGAAGEVLGPAFLVLGTRRPRDVPRQRFRAMPGA